MSAVEQLRACGAALDRACDRLTDPTAESLDVCSTILHGAIDSLSSAQPTLRSGDPAALAEAWRLRRSVRRAGILLANAAEYHRRWQDSIQVRISGYRPDGRPGDTVLSGRISLRA
jgi:hypothetical protein